MKTIYITIIFLIGLTCTTAGFAQQSFTTPKIETDVPKFAPPSPTVAALMKFEEIPVNNYTGVPDISIPLYSISSRSQDVSLNLSLSYHPASIAADEVASYTGLGWNLMAGGTISRTVRGLPDEVKENDKVGMWQNDGTANSDNNYKVIESRYLALQPQPYTATEEDQVNKFLFEGHEKGRYDTEYDLYQFNFMGHTGRFYMKRNFGTLQIKRLDNDDAIKIEVAHDSTFNVTSFTVLDDKGNKYIFDVKETTKEKSTTSTTRFFLTGGGGSHIAPESSYTSAYHLASIIDTNGQTLLTFHYNKNNEDIVEYARTSTQTRNDMLYTTPAEIQAGITGHCFYEASAGFDMYSEVNTLSERIIKTKKLKRISVEGKAHIYFSLGPRFENDPNNRGFFSLSEIIIKKWDTLSPDAALKKFTFNYNYSEVNYPNPQIYIKRMMLHKLTESNFIDTTTLSHEFFYADRPTLGTVGKDYWGYFNIIPENETNLYRKTTPSFVTRDVLRKIKLPTGGCKILDFESNTYTHEGSVPLPDYRDNPHNWTNETFTCTFTNPMEISAASFSISDEQDVQITAQAQFDGFYVDDPQFLINIYAGSSTVPGGINNEGGSSNPPLTFNGQAHLLPGGYKIGFSCPNKPLSGTINVVVTVYYKKYIETQKYVYGGGVRIKSIKYYDQDVSLTTTPPFPPAKRKDYNYHFFDANESAKSSGSLVVPKPVFEYNRNIKTWFECPGVGAWTMPLDGILYKVSTSFNNVIALKTQGADVGYRNVTVSETGLGKSRYCYRSPITHPEGGYSLTYPFMASKNFDYRRGLLDWEEIWDNDNNKLVRTDYDYEYSEREELTGLRLYTPQNCERAKLSATYNDYKYHVQQCFNNPGEHNADCIYSCNYPIEYILHKPIYEAVGWAKMTVKTTTEFFYNGSTPQGIIESKEYFTFNNINKKLAGHTVETYKDGSNVETILNTYSYNTFPNNNITEINEIKSYKNMELLSNRKIEYANNFPNNISYLPKYIQAAKGSQPLENRVEFVKYDQYGNVLEVKQTNGSPVSYIYGYNSTLPIAMIENVPYGSLSTTRRDAAINASNVSNNEADLLIKLYNLRTFTESAFPDAKITTYTHKPLIGVSTITDTEQIKTTYHYDGFGRLTAVKDANGNLLSENEYHYRP